MLPAMHHACAETTGALRSSRTMMVRPFSSVVSWTPGGMDGMSPPLFAMGTPWATKNYLRLGAGSRRGDSHRTRLLAGREIWLAEGLEKIVAALKIGAAVFFCLRQPANFHHIEHELAEIFAGVDAPFLKQVHRHRAELRYRKVSNARQKLLSTDVAALASALFDDGFLCVIQRLADKRIGLAMVARVFDLDPFYRFFKTHFVHG